MINMLCADDSGTYSIQLTEYERNALQKRLGQIDVALGHPRWTAKQLVALRQERAELEHKLAR